MSWWAFRWHEYWAGDALVGIRSTDSEYAGIWQNVAGTDVRFRVFFDTNVLPTEYIIARKEANPHYLKTILPATTIEFRGL